jgi:hypothetical protein
MAHPTWNQFLLNFETYSITFIDRFDKYSCEKYTMRANVVQRCIKQDGWGLNGGAHGPWTLCFGAHIACTSKSMQGKPTTHVWCVVKIMWRLPQPPSKQMEKCSMLKGGVPNNHNMQS